MQDSDSSIEKLKKQLDSLISDKELVTTQITRKCEEIELLNQKINMMQMALDRSETSFAEFFEVAAKQVEFGFRQQPVQRPAGRHKVPEN